MVDMKFRILAARKGSPRTTTERNEAFRIYPVSFRHAALLRDEGLARDDGSKLGKWSSMPWYSAALTWVVDTQLAPLGRTPAAFMTYRGRRDVNGMRAILQLPLQRVYARVVDGKIRYDDVVSEHEMGFVTFPGARGRIIDGCNMAVGINDSTPLQSYDWACNAVALLQQHRDLLRKGPYGISTVPQLPHIFAGFSQPSAAHISGPAAKRAAAVIAGVTADMTENELQQLLTTTTAGKSVLEGLFVAPGVATNTTRKWLIRQEYLSYIGDNVPLYEDFTSRCGVEVENPARFRNNRLRVFNPAKLAAQNVKIDLKKMLTLYSSATRGGGIVGRAESQCDITDEILDVISTEILPSFRKILGRLSPSYSDDAILKAIMYPNRELEQVSPTPPQSDAEKLDYGFGYLASKMPHLLGRVTSEDMLLAFEYPNRPLFARNACDVQHIRLDKFGHARYSAQQLGRYRVSVDAL